MSGAISELDQPKYREYAMFESSGCWLQLEMVQGTIILDPGFA